MKRESQPSRREFLQSSGRLAAASALASLAFPHVHAAEDNTLRLALIGCGGRGSGAVANAMNSPGGPVKLVAMADLFDKRMEGSYKSLASNFQFCPHVDQLTDGSPAPLKGDAAGHYPVPIPGQWSEI